MRDIRGKRIGAAGAVARMMTSCRRGLHPQATGNLQPRQKKSPAEAGLFLLRVQSCYCWTCSSVRRLRARPESVSLLSIGSASPWPIGPSRRLASMPCEVR